MPIRIRLNRAGRRRTSSGYVYKERPVTICLDPEFKPKQVPDGCGTTKCESPEKVHVATIPLKKLYHPCQECVPCGTGYYNPSKDNYSKGCKECCN